MEKTIQKGAPDMQSIIEQGIREGVFHTDYPREAAAFYMQLNVMLNDSINKILLDQGKQPERIEKIRNLLLFYEDLMKKTAWYRDIISDYYG